MRRPPSSGALFNSERDLVAACVALGALEVGGRLSRAEAALARRASAARRVDPAALDQVRASITRGKDPLGEEFCRLRPQEQRRVNGAFYTPDRVVRAMLSWVLDHRPARIVDAGCGSGRFAVAARRMGFAGDLVAIDIDPLATLMTRAHLAAAGARRARVLNADFLARELSHRRLAPTAFIGNPPYVRHHGLTKRVKNWAQRTAKDLGVPVSGLAGSHALFILAASKVSRDGDPGCFITSAEWLDVAYGEALRRLLSGRLGCVRLDLIDPTAAPFDDAMSTALIVSWQVGYMGPVRVRRLPGLATLQGLAGGRLVPRQRLAGASRWSDLHLRRPKTDGLVPLGSLARVHRGVATGANDFFVMSREDAARRNVAHHVRPCLTRASQVILAPGIVRADKLEYVLLDLPANTNDPAVEAYLAEGRRRGIPDRYLCAHRRPWWRVGGSPPPQIIATYMARRPPVFALNPDRCQIVNVFHGLHFREPVSDEAAAALVRWLNAHRDSLAGGRTYHGGLRKFEPSELEALLVPPLDRLIARADE